MAQQIINPTPDTHGDARSKINANFTELYDIIPDVTVLESANAESIKVVKSADDLLNIDSTKTYYLDGHIDMGTTEILVPSGGIVIKGGSSANASLITSEDNFTLFKSDVGGCGSLVIENVVVTISGANSKVFDVTSTAGLNAVFLHDINFYNCTEIGTLSGFFQGVMDTTALVGGTPNLTFDGTWDSGFRITSMSVVNLDPLMTGAIFQAGGSFVVQSRFRCDANVDLPANVSVFDFSPTNFINPSSFQLKDMRVSRNGVLNADDANYTPNISRADLVCNWDYNVGLPNTFIGGTMDIVTESLTTITAPNTPVPIAGTWSASDLQHFTSPANGHLQHKGVSPRAFRVVYDIVLECSANKDITLHLVIDRNGGGTEYVSSQTRVINNLQGGRDVGYFGKTTNVVLDKDDVIRVEVENETDSDNITIELDSFIMVGER